jgi:septal ring factor EnvC (AmiA/AmiB activator)
MTATPGEPAASPALLTQHLVLSEHDEAAFVNRRTPSRRGAARGLPAAVLAGLALAVASAQTPVPPPDADRARALEQRAAERLQGLQQEADALARQQRGLLDRLRALELARAVAAAELERATAAVERVRGDAARVASRLSATERVIDLRRPEVQARLTALHAAGPPAALRRLLATGDRQDTAGAERLLAAVSSRDRRVFSTFAALRDDLRRQQAELQRQQAALEPARQAAARARDAAAAATAAHEKLVRDVDRRRDLAAELAGELETARAKLQRHVEGLSTTGEDLATLPLEPFRGTLPWPVAGSVEAAYGRQRSSRFGTAVARHGVDIAAPAGTVVSAIHEGRVAFAGAFAGFGRIVIVDHGGGAFSLYGHLDEVAVQKGVRVDRGTRVGSVGLTPAGTPALYFELRIDARPVNPVEWLKR